jgi:hypothetical protein
MPWSWMALAVAGVAVGLVSAWLVVQLAGIAPPKPLSTLPVRATAPGPGETWTAAVAPPDLPALAARRATVLMLGQVTALSEIEAPGSQAMAADEALIGRLRDLGLRLSGLRFEVRSVTLMDGGTRADGTTWRRMAARVQTSAHRQIDSSGRVVANVPAGSSQPMLLTLVRLRSRTKWLVESVKKG